MGKEKLFGCTTQLDLKISCIEIFVENQSAIRLALNADHHNRTKHIDNTLSLRT